MTKRDTIKAVREHIEVEGVEHPAFRGSYLVRPATGPYLAISGVLYKGRDRAVLAVESMADTYDEAIRSGLDHEQAYHAGVSAALKATRS